MKGSDSIKEIENYTNTKKTLELIRLRIAVINENNHYLFREKEQLVEMENSLDRIIKKMEINLQELKGIEHSLYYEIVVNGLNVNKAVDKISLYYDVSVSTIWKSYYPSVKKQIKDLEIMIANFQ